MLTLAQNVQMSDYSEYSNSSGGGGGGGNIPILLFGLFVIVVVVGFVGSFATDLIQRWCAFRARNTRTSTKEVRKEMNQEFHSPAIILVLVCTCILCYLSDAEFCGMVFLIPFFVCTTAYGLNLILPTFVSLIWNSDFLRR